MNQPNDPVDPLLERLLAGEIGLDAEAVQQRMQLDPDFAAEAEALLTLAAELDPPPASVHGEPEPWTGADQAMAELVRKHARPPARAPVASRRRRWPWLLAAAAAAALAALLLTQRDGLRDNGLRDNGLRDNGLREPTGPVNLQQHGDLPELSISRSQLAALGFDWTKQTQQRAATYRLEFHDLQRRPLPGTAPIEQRSTTFRPPAELIARLPHQFLLQITESTGHSPPQPWTQRVTLLD